MRLGWAVWSSHNVVVRGCISLDFPSRRTSRTSLIGSVRLCSLDVLDNVGADGVHFMTGWGDPVLDPQLVILETL